MINQKMSPKWQRLMYMPGTGLYEDGRRVTGSKKHIEISRSAAREGMVLLKNDDNALPLKEGTKLALFGKGQHDYVQGGGGSGVVYTAYERSLLEGLEIKESESKISLYPLTYISSSCIHPNWSLGNSFTIPINWNSRPALSVYTNSCYILCTNQI